VRHLGTSDLSWHVNAVALWVALGVLALVMILGVRMNVSLQANTAAVDHTHRVIEALGAGIIAISTAYSAFGRLHTTREFPGIGIGLATAHRIVQRHGGRIRGDGHVDEGAAFFFTLHHRPGGRTI
jgi:light-regulated signal transduction histidine kinase (bacteriophytochrome)